ncbi:hypothetical protein CEXT_273351 [Caerostris extrusa]|uniref:Uncharacterized protein n=1 Tax=Caerostris extrusa TaxID=172846 RepID=A0AAV4S252_CAEEX|nr:hypothetical protein CEXT_273351 [Caerostris extrusa]
MSYCDFCAYHAHMQTDVINDGHCVYFHHFRNDWHWHSRCQTAAWSAHFERAAAELSHAKIDALKMHTYFNRRSPAQPVCGMLKTAMGFRQLI